MENRNIKKASAIYRWTMKKYRSITIAYGVLLILSLPVVELLSILSAYSMNWNEDLNTYVNVVTEMEVKPLMVLPIMVAVIFSGFLWKSAGQQKNVIFCALSGSDYPDGTSVSCYRHYRRRPDVFC